MNKLDKHRIKLSRKSDDGKIAILICYRPEGPAARSQTRHQISGLRHLSAIKAAVSLIATKLNFQVSNLHTPIIYLKFNRV